MTNNLSDAPVSTLRQRMIEDMNMRRFARKTQFDYVRHVARFARVDPLSRASAGLPELRFAAAMHAQHARSQGHPIDPRRRARPRPQYRHHRRLSCVTPPTEEGRDAVRPSQAHPKLDRLRLRGPNGARDEFHLAAAAQNLRKMAKSIPMARPALA